MTERLWRLAGAAVVTAALGGVGVVAHRKGHEGISSLCFGGAAGVLVTEIGDAVVEKYGTPIHLDHDVLGLGGLGATFLVGKSGKVDARTRNLMYGFFGSVLVHHLATEGVSFAG